MSVPDQKKMSEEEKNQAAAESVFAFKDPRLRHMNKNFKREDLYAAGIEIGNSEGVRSALDDIIKFNLMTLEFNYMQDLF